MTRQLQRLASSIFVAAVATGMVSASAAVPLLDEVEALYVKEGTFLRDLNLQQVREIRSQDEAGRAVDGWSLSRLIFGLKTESEKEVVSNPDVALRKVELALRAADQWRPLLQGISLRDEGHLLMTRWFLRGNPQDQELARERFTRADTEPSNAAFQGGGAFFLGASYEMLAGWARETGRSRDEQIALLRAGIEANKAGRAKYSFDSTIGLGALYRKLEHVSGGSALPLYVDEWVQYMQTQTEKAQMSAALGLADALFQQGRDAEGVEWINRYARYWALAEVKPELRARSLEFRCLSMSPSINSGFAQYRLRQAASFASLRDRVCSGTA